MKSTRHSFILLIVLTLLSSCQKEFGYSNSSSDPVPGTPAGSASSKVKTYTEDYTSSSSEHEIVTFNLSYDERDRIKSMISAASPGDKFVYNYDSANTFTMDIYNSNQLSIHAVFFINSLSLRDSSLQYNEMQDTTTGKYLYNSSKQLVGQKEYSYTSEGGSVLETSHEYSYDSVGNLLKEISGDNVTTYTYYTDLTDNVTMGQQYITLNKNLVKTTTYTEGRDTYTLTHTYTFDDLKRLTSEKIVSDAGDIIVKSYTY
jgi:hypothetical protein